MAGLDIPEGTIIGEVIKGGETAYERTINILKERFFSGYVKVEVELEGKKIKSYMIVKDSEPKLGLREVVTRDKLEPRKGVRKVYAGKNTLDEIKNDLANEEAVIELHSGVDIEGLIARFSKDKDKSSLEKAKKSARVGLFWGGKPEEETLDREVLKGKLNDWKREGYKVSELEGILSEDLEDVKDAFEKFEKNLAILEDMAVDLDLLSLAGFESEVASLKWKLKDPEQIPNLRGDIADLEKRSSLKKEGKTARICLVCGFRLKDEEKCPRCGAFVEKEAEEEKPTITELAGGHCYLVEEEKMNKSLGLFTQLLKKGYSGFCITRTNPKHLRERKDLGQTKVVWLTNKESATETTISPVLERIIYEISNFLRQEEKGCLILDGIEYLISNNGFDAVLRFIRNIVDDVSEGKSILLVTVGPYTLKDQELKILEREMRKI